MSKSQRLRVSEVRRAVRLVGECRDLGRDPTVWLGHLLAGLRSQQDAQLALCWVQPPGGLQVSRAVLHTATNGWLSPTDFQTWSDAYLTCGIQCDLGYQRFRQKWRPRLTLRREELLTGREYHTGENFNQYRRPFGIDDYIGMDVQWPGGPASLSVNVHRRLGGPAYTQRESRLLHLTGLEVVRLLGRRLAVGPDRLRVGLPARQGQVLDALLEGDGEKQVAARLGLSRHTVNEYVGQLYRRYEVHTRAELLALFAGR